MIGLYLLADLVHIFLEDKSALGVIQNMKLITQFENC